MSWLVCVSWLEPGDAEVFGDSVGADETTDLVGADETTGSVGAGETADSVGAGGTTDSAGAAKVANWDWETGGFEVGEPLPQAAISKVIAAKAATANGSR